MEEEIGIKINFDNRKFIISLSIIVILLISLILAVSLVQTKQIFKPKATENKESKQATVLPKPDYIKGEVLVKFRPQALKIKVRPEKSIQGISFDKKAVNFSDLDQSSLPPILTLMNKKYQIKEIEKIFKGAQFPEEELVKFKKLFAEDISSGKRKLEEKELLKINLSNSFRVSFVKNFAIETVVYDLLSNPDIEFAEPNYKYKTQLVPNDPYYLDTHPTNVSNRDPLWNPSHDYQWNMKRIQLEQALNIASGSAQVLVAVIDTGVDYTHLELGACTLSTVNGNNCLKVAPGYDVVNDDNDPIDDNGHGTHVAGIIAAYTNNSIGMAGIADNAKIIPLKGFGQYGDGLTNNLALAIYMAIDKGAKIINASWGGAGDSQILTEAIAFGFFQGVNFVVSAGNSNSDVGYFYPANISCASSDRPSRDCTITVASTDQNYQKSSFSNFGTGIDVAAPGGDYSGNILSLKAKGYSGSNTVGGEYLRLSGTSMAAPHVSGLASLILGKNASLSAEQVRNIIVNGADDYGLASFDVFHGYGQINLFKSLNTMNTNIPLIARISLPQQDFLVGKKFKIFGSAFGFNFSNYTIEYASFAKPEDWSSSGVKLYQSGNKEVYNGNLSDIDLSGLSNGTYYLRLKTNSTDGRSAFTTVSIRVDASIRDGFPTTFGSFVLDHMPVIADINADNKKEIIFKSANEAKVYAVEPDGSVLSGWPISTQETPEGLSLFRFLQSTPVVSDLDTSYPGLEVVIPVNTDPLFSSTSSGIQLLALHADGTKVPGWTIEDWKRRGSLGFLSYRMSMSSGVISGKNVIVYAENSPYKQNQVLGLHLFDQAGNDLPGWPVVLENYAVNRTPIITDLDKDNDQEIIVDYFYNSTNHVRIYSSSGKLKKEVPFSSNDYLTNMLAADIDKDGLIEILATTYNFSIDNQVFTTGGGGGDGQVLETGKLFIWDHLGRLKSNKFPFVLEGKENYILGFGLLSLGDYNNDQSPEILLYFRHQFYLLDKDANLLKGFPTSGQTSFWTRPSLAANVSLTNGNHLIALGELGYWSGLLLYEHNSTIGGLSIPEGYPKNFSLYYDVFGISGQPAILDLENDTKLELIVPVEFVPAGWLEVLQSNLYVFDLSYSAKFLDWPQYLHDERHSSVYLPNFGSVSIKTPTSFGNCYKGCSDGSSCGSGLTCGGGWCRVGQICTHGFKCYNQSCPYDPTCKCQITPTPKLRR